MPLESDFGVFSLGFEYIGGRQERAPFARAADESVQRLFDSNAYSVLPSGIPSAQLSQRPFEFGGTGLSFRLQHFADARPSPEHQALRVSTDSQIEQVVRFSGSSGYFGQAGDLPMTAAEYRDTDHLQMDRGAANEVREITPNGTLTQTAAIDSAGFPGALLGLMVQRDEPYMVGDHWIPNGPGELWSVNADRSTEFMVSNSVDSVRKVWFAVRDSDPFISTRSSFTVAPGGDRVKIHLTCGDVCSTDGVYATGIDVDSTTRSFSRLTSAGDLVPVLDGVGVNLVLDCVEFADELYLPDNIADATVTLCRLNADSTATALTGVAVSIFDGNPSNLTVCDERQFPTGNAVPDTVFRGAFEVRNVLNTMDADQRLRIVSVIMRQEREIIAKDVIGLEIGAPEPIIGTVKPEVLRGTARGELISGLAGKDKLLGFAGKDTLIGGAGNDEIRSGSGNDTALGGDGQDRIFGNGGRDTLFGGTGRDAIGAGKGDDLIRGRSESDVLLGAQGDDRILGGTGNDTIRAGSGQDKLTGGIGSDLFVFRRGDGADRITDFADNQDTISLDVRLWGGGLSVEEVITLFATLDGSTALLDFGSVELRIRGVASLTDLHNDILFD